MTRRIRTGQHDLVVHVIGRCVGALVVNKLAADINSRNNPVRDDELACLSAILGTKSDDVMLLLSHPGAIEFTNMFSSHWTISTPPPLPECPRMSRMWFNRRLASSLRLSQLN
jgi:hypothetical protein